MLDQQRVEAIDGLGAVPGAGGGEDGAELVAQAPHGVEVAMGDPAAQVRPAGEQRLQSPQIPQGVPAAVPGVHELDRQVGVRGEVHVRS
jgi:hypothetical protein